MASENKGADMELGANGDNDVAAEPPPKKKSSRRPDIDLIRVVLTWGILLYHTVLIYTPEVPYYVKILPETVTTGYLVPLWFVISMNAWNMPMFFFLSGISAFFGLKKRSERQFRAERCHRLLVPALTLALTSSLLISLNYVAKLTPGCEQYYHYGEAAEWEGWELLPATVQQYYVDLTGYGNITTVKQYLAGGTSCDMYFKFHDNTSYVEHLRGFYRPVPSPHQGWFLCYLFIYSQLLVSLFIAVHPNHQEDSFLCLKRPYNKAVQVFCCFNFFGYLTPSDEKFVNAVKFWLGHPVKLFLVPSLWIGVVEAALRTQFPDGNLWFFGAFTDLCNDIKFIFIFVIGYGITAADEHGMKEVISKGRWYNFVIGTIILIGYSFKWMVDHLIWAKILFFILRGFSEWLFIIGVYGVLRELVTAPLPGLAKLSELAMPFYLTHQQILIAIAALCSWVPYLRSFPIVLILSTVGSLAASLLVTKAGPLRYLFGLPTMPGSLLPGKKNGGFLPLHALGAVFIALSFVANFV